MEQTIEKTDQHFAQHWQLEVLYNHNEWSVYQGICAEQLSTLILNESISGMDFMKMINTHHINE